MAHIFHRWINIRTRCESQESPETNVKLKTFAPYIFFRFVFCVCSFFFFKLFRRQCDHNCNSPNIFLAHKSVDYDYLASFLVMNCPDDPDGTCPNDAVDFVQPKLLAVHFPTHLILRWMERPIIRHKPLLNLPDAPVDHPARERKKTKWI